jgi:hypothetical protein
MVYVMSEEDYRKLQEEIVYLKDFAKGLEALVDRAGTEDEGNWYSESMAYIDSIENLVDYEITEPDYESEVD